MKVNIALLTVTDTRTLNDDKSGGILVSKISEANHNLIDKKISIGYLPQDIISGTRSSVLEETLKSFPELNRIEIDLDRLHDIIKHDPKNISAIKAIGDLQQEYEAIGGWSIENKAKKILGGLGFKEDQIGRAHV